MRGVVEESDLKSVKLINVQPHFCDYVPFVGFRGRGEGVFES